MTDQPILFSGPMVRAILYGRKTQTRRVIKPQPVRFNNPDWPCTHGWREVPYMGGWEISWNNDRMTATEAIGEYCPYGQSGDQLWVRETWAALHPGTDDVMWEVNPQPPICSLAYKATDERSINGNWRPSIFMPRWASRITLEVVSVRVQRLQEISYADGNAEGFDSLDGFALLWDRINAKRGCGWQDNPWVWAVEFRAVTA